MATRWTPMFDDGSETPVTSSTYDTKGEAEKAGLELASDELRFVQVVRHIGHTDLIKLAAELQQRTSKLTALNNQKRHSGLITRWDTTSGFATDSTGQSWFVSCGDLPDGYDSLAFNTKITWAGSPHPGPGKRYPQARSIQVDQS